MFVSSGHLRPACLQGAGVVLQGAGPQLHREHAVGIDGAWEGDQAARDAAEAEAGVVGLIAHQHDEGDAGGAGVRKGAGRQPAAVAPVGQVGLDRQGPSSKAPSLPPMRTGVKRTAAISRSPSRDTRQKGENPSAAASRTR